MSLFTKIINKEYLITLQEFLNKNFYKGYILYYILGFLACVIIFKVLKAPFKLIKKIIFNSISGYITLLILSYFNIFVVPFTYLNYFIVGSFGILGILFIYFFF